MPLPHNHRQLKLDELFQRIDALEPDFDQPSDEEICQIVQEVRHRRAIHESNPFFKPITDQGVNHGSGA